MLDFSLRGVLIGILMVSCLVYANAMKQGLVKVLLIILGGIALSTLIFFLLPGGDIELTKMSGIGLSAITGVVLNLVLPKRAEEEDA